MTENKTNPDRKAGETKKPEEPSFQDRKAFYEDWLKMSPPEGTLPVGDNED